MDDMLNAIAAYQEAFGENPPRWGWDGEDDDYIALVHRAIRERTPLTQAMMDRSQGKDPPPEDDPDIVF